MAEEHSAAASTAASSIRIIDRLRSERRACNSR
jgi:hypothetical protein